MFGNSIVALLTPMDATGRIDYGALRSLINGQIHGGTSAIVVGGTTGEFATLTTEERLRLIERSLICAAGRIPIIAGVGLNSTVQAVTFIAQVEQLGVAGALVVTPYYNRPNQEGLVAHFMAIAEASKLPQILYNVPSRTGCDLLPETVGKLAEVENIVGIKEASGDLSRVKLLRRATGGEFYLFSGDDATSLDFIQLGGNGVISVTANIAPSTISEICRLGISSQFSAAACLEQTIYQLHQALFVEPNPIPVKWAAHRLGLIASDMVRLPLTRLSAAKQDLVEQALCSARYLP